MGSPKDQSFEENQEFTPVRKESTPLSNEDNLLAIIEDGEIKKKIQEKLKKVILEELNGMSSGLRNALKQWVQREKEKYSFVTEEEALVSQGSNRSLKVQMKLLEAENEKLKKQLSFKDKENQLVLDAIKEMQRRNKA